jgi:NO-binding membrane sensor protein with MHYT domain
MMTELREPQSSLPPGYRQGAISAITVVIGFSLVFMRYWNFEVTGRLTYTASAAALALMAAILLEFYTLWRALQPEDEQDSEYRKTLRWFMRSVAVLLVSVTIASLATTGIAP